MSELDWGWSQIAVVLMWRLAPKGMVLFHADLDLPRDRVMLERREPTYIRLTFISMREAFSRTHAAKPTERATSDKLAGRWQQIAAVMLWKLAKHGVTLTEADRESVPKNVELLTSGHPDGVEWRFLPIVEAQVIRDFEMDNEGKIIMEATHL